MKKIFFTSAIIALLAAGCGGNSPSGPNSSSGSTASSSAATASGTKLSDEPYANSAYEIDPNNMSAAAKQATQGFNISSQTLANGDTKITLAANGNPEYHTQAYELKSGQKLYFIEQNPGDDQPDHDAFAGDDTAVVVDQNGYVVQQ